LDSTPNSNGWCNADVQVTIEASDATSGVATTEYSTDGGDSWDVYSGPFPISFEGTTTLIARAIDNAGNVGASTDPVTIYMDKTPPAVTGSVSQRCLWPPNHELVEITLTMTVADLDPNPAVDLSVASSEDDDAAGGGDGHTTGDTQVVDMDTVMMRAERDGKGSGRLYTITYLVADVAGNSTTYTSHVFVPHDMGEAHHCPLCDG
jgi:hypothetical protein